MSFEYFVEQDSEIRTLKKEEQEELVGAIVKNYLSYEDNRAANLSKSNAVIDEIFFKKDISNIKDKSERWKSKIKMCKTYMFYQTLKAFIWRNIYSNVNSMFDVSGENHEADNNSNKQKAVLVDMLEKMGFSKTCDKVIDNALLYGELISYTAWRKKYQEYRRPIEFFKHLFSKDILKLSQIMQAVRTGQNFWTDKIKTYDNPYIYSVSPADLVFDVSQVDNWDSCPKIYRTFKTPYDITNNKFYNIDKLTAQNIHQLIRNGADLKKQSKSNFENETVNGSTVEVLEHFGDLKLPSGEILKNWHVVIVGRKYLVKFQKNESIINPFTYGAFITDPDTKRGISPLYCVLSLAEAQEEFLNRTINLQSLSENPPLLAPEGFFEEDEISLYPGKIIEYGDNLSSVSALKQIDFDNKVFLADIEFLDTLMCEVSGIYPSMIGIQENFAKTATEITTKTQGQLTRLAMLLDIINQDFIVPCVKNIAMLSANFKQGLETVFVNHNNSQDTIVIDDEIRQADYKYTYSDRNMISEKSVNADMVIQVLEKFAQVIPLDVAELFTWYFEQKGVENSERFLDQEKLQFMKQNDKLQMVTQSNNMIGQLSQIMSNSAQKDNNEETDNTQETPEQESEPSESVLPKLYELAKEHILSKGEDEQDV